MPDAIVVKNTAANKCLICFIIGAKISKSAQEKYFMCTYLLAFKGHMPCLPAGREYGIYSFSVCIPAIYGYFIRAYFRVLNRRTCFRRSGYTQAGGICHMFISVCIPEEYDNFMEQLDFSNLAGCLLSLSTLLRHLL